MDCSHKLRPLKERWQPSSEERPRASSTGRLRTTRTGTSIVQDIYDRLGVKREDLKATTMIQRTASLDEDTTPRYNTPATVLDAQDANLNEAVPHQQPQRRLSTLKSRWPPKVKGAEPALETTSTTSSKKRISTLPSTPRRAEEPIVPASPGGGLLKFQSLSPALRKRLQQRSSDATTPFEDQVEEGVEPKRVVARGPPAQIECWEDEKKEDDVVKASSSIKDRLRAYKSTTTPRQIASYRERPPLIDIYSGSTSTGPVEVMAEPPPEATGTTTHHRNAGVANAFLAAIQTPRSAVVPDTIVPAPDAHSETESVSMLSSTSDPEQPSPKASRTTVSMHKKIQWLEQRANGATSRKPEGKKTTPLPSDLERLVDERVNIKVAEAEQKLEERLRQYIHELHNRRSSGMW